MIDIENLPSECNDLDQLLKALQKYKELVKGEEWDQLRSRITQKKLLPIARKWAFSLSWKKRYKAASSFAIAPLSQDEPLILKLLDDPKFLVQSEAAYAAVAIESEKGVQKILEHMSSHSDYARMFYRDVLQKGSKKVLERVLLEASRPDLHEASIEVLSGRFLGSPLPFLSEDLESKNAHIRTISIDILSHNPTKNAVEILTKCMSDKEESVRKKAIQALGNFPSKEAFDPLMRVLTSNEKKRLKLEALRSLKKLQQINELPKEVIQNQQISEMLSYIESFG